MIIALYQPDIPQNTGTILRLGACLSIDIHIIEPTGFDTSDKGLKRAGMDYLARSRCIRHLSFEKFLAARSDEERIILMTTKGAEPYHQFIFLNNDILLFGRESLGVPQEVHDLAHHRVFIPMDKQARSLNLALSVGMVAGEALRQNNGFNGFN